MTNRIFKFDPNKCTGCNACQIACILENDLNYNSSWRQVVTYNEHRYPAQQVFHLSMACNHCGDPPCLKYCPAQAYHHDEKFGTVQIVFQDTGNLACITTGAFIRIEFKNPICHDIRSTSTRLS